MSRDETILRAAEFLEWYADFIRRDVMCADIERHPYLPELEEVAAEIRAMVSPSRHKYNPLCECHNCHVIARAATATGIHP